MLYGRGGEQRERERGGGGTEVEEETEVKGKGREIGDGEVAALVFIAVSACNKTNYIDVIKILFLRKYCTRTRCTGILLKENFN